LLQRLLLSKAGSLSEPSFATSEHVCHEAQATSSGKRRMKNDVGRGWLRFMQGNHPKNCKPLERIE
jgi:hypothetical protein